MESVSGLQRETFPQKRSIMKILLEVAKQVEDHGIKYIHLVDLDGAKNKRIINYEILEKIASKTAVLRLISEVE